MTCEIQWEQMDPADRKVLAEAVRRLEQGSFAARAAEMAAEPLQRFARKLPGNVGRKLQDIVTAALIRALNTVIRTMDGEAAGPPQTWLPKLMAGVTGGVSGFFGLAALALELPVTTTIMLRAIAEIARSEGENVRSARTRLACLEVFALGSRGGEANLHAGYYATRAALAHAVSEAGSLVVERAVAEEGAPAMARLMTEIASRFGMAVSDRVAASAVPVIGALGGAAINVVFMDHFQQMAKSHFTVRRLERKYGAETVRRLYLAFAAKSGH
jgi:hypothetical protein